MSGWLLCLHYAAYTSGAVLSLFALAPLAYGCRRVYRARGGA